MSKVFSKPVVRAVTMIESAIIIALVIERLMFPMIFDDHRVLSIVMTLYIAYMAGCVMYDWAREVINAHREDYEQTTEQQ